MASSVIATTPSNTEQHHHLVDNPIYLHIDFRLSKAYTSKLLKWLAIKGTLSWNIFTVNFMIAKIG